MTRLSFTSIITISTCIVSLFISHPSKAAYVRHRHEKLLSKRMESMIRGPRLPFQNPARPLMSAHKSHRILLANENYLRQWNELDLKSDTMLSLAESLGIRGDHVLELQFDGWRHPTTLDWDPGSPKSQDQIEEIQSGLKWYRSMYRL